MFYLVFLIWRRPVESVMSRASTAIRKLFAHRKASDPISDAEKSLAAALSSEARTRVAISAPPAAYIPARKTSTDLADSCGGASVLSGSTIVSDASLHGSDGAATRGDPDHTGVTYISGISAASAFASNDTFIHRSDASLCPSTGIAPDIRGTPLVPTAMGVLMLTPTLAGGSAVPFDFGPTAYAGPSLLRMDRHADAFLAQTGARTEVLSALAPRQRVVSLGTAAELARARVAIGHPTPLALAELVPVPRSLSDLAPGVQVLPLPPRVASADAHSWVCRAGIDYFAGPATPGRQSSS